MYDSAPDLRRLDVTGHNGMALPTFTINSENWIGEVSVLCINVPLTDDMTGRSFTTVSELSPWAKQANDVAIDTARREGKFQMQMNGKRQTIGMIDFKIGEFLERFWRN